MFSTHLMAWPPKKIKRGTYVEYSTQFQNEAGPVSCILTDIFAIEARSARNGPKVWLHCTHITKKKEDINGNVFIEASCNSSYLAVWLRITSLSFRIKSLKDLQRASSIPSSGPKFSLYPVIAMVIFGILHPVHTFNPESHPFYFKIPDTGLQIRQIPHPENPTGDRLLG